MSDRHTIRAEWHNYNAGVYFITICTHQKLHIFGRISNGEMVLSPEGKIVNEYLSKIPNHHTGAEIWNHVVMPNHIHFVLNVGAQYFAPAPLCLTPKDIYQNFPTNVGCIKHSRHGVPRTDNHYNSKVSIIVRSFKAACSIEINRSRRAQNIAPLQLWQRNYHEHIIRDQHAFEKIMLYINNNIANWDSDCFCNKII